MKTVNEHDEQYAQKKIGNRQQRLLSKFAVKTYAQQYYPIFVVCLVASVLFQITSLATAITLPASWFNKIFQSWVAGFLIAAVFLILLEIFKRFLVSNASKNYLQFGKKKLLFIAAIPAVFSIISSTLGTPILIKEFGYGPSKIDTSAVAKDFDNKIAATTLFWSSLSEKSSSDAEKIHQQNSWKDVTTRSARPIVLEHEKKASGYTDSLVAARSLLSKEKASAISAIASANTAAADKDKIDKEEVGLILGLCTFGIELLFCIMIFWCEYYDYREALEIESNTRVREKKLPDNIRKIVKKKTIQKTIQQQAKDLRNEGKSYREIGSILEVTHTSARRYCQA